MKLGKTIEFLNDVYRQLDERSVRLSNLLSKLGYSVERGYFNQHTVTVDEEMLLEHYPIPVITIKDVCEIGLDIMQVSIEGRFYREEALNLDFSKLKKYKFECYGIENYLENFYEPGMALEDIAGSIELSEENEIGVNIILDGEPLTKEIIECIQLIEDLGAHVISRDAEKDDDGGAFDTEIKINDESAAFEVADALDEMF